MKQAGIVLLVFLMAICMTTNDVWAGAQVYLTISVGGGLFISVIGVCIQVALQQRIAQKQEKSKLLAGARLYEPKRKEPDSSPRQLVRVDSVLTHLDPSKDSGQAVYPDIEVNFFTFRW